MLRGLEADGRAQPVALGLNHSPSWQAWQNADSESKEAFWPTGLGFLHLKSDVLVPLAAEWAKLRNAGLRLGRSCHSPAEVQLAADDGFDFVFLSPIFPTASHPATPALGLGALAAVCNGTPMRVYALGGVESETQAQACRQAGAAGVAAIRWFAA
jgi:thiamine monophosphate synthase